MKFKTKSLLSGWLSILGVLTAPAIACASEANLVIPELSSAQNSLLYIGIGVCVFGMLFGLYQSTKVKKLVAHQTMLDVAETIYETCKTYLVQQGKFIGILFIFIKEKGTPLHDATVVGDTVGDPFKDTSSVALNPIIKFTTLFGLLAMEIAISEAFRDIAPYAGIVFLAVALIFVWRTFYAMRIPSGE